MERTSITVNDGSADFQPPSRGTSWAEDSKDCEPQPAQTHMFEFDFSKFKKCNHGLVCKNPDCIFVHDETALKEPELALEFALKCQRAAAKNYNMMEVEKSKSTQLEHDIEWYKREMDTLKRQSWNQSGSQSGFQQFGSRDHVSASAVFPLAPLRSPLRRPCAASGGRRVYKNRPIVFEHVKISIRVGEYHQR